MGPARFTVKGLDLELDGVVPCIPAEEVAIAASGYQESPPRVLGLEEARAFGHLRSHLRSCDES